MNLRTYNLFISHSWGYRHHYDRLQKLLRKRCHFKFKNYSVPKNDPIHTSGTAKELRQAIRRQMAPCSVILVLAGVYSSYSKWIRTEMNLANQGFQNPKPIIAIKPWGSIRISATVRDATAEVVHWNSKSIVDAIRRNSKKRKRK